MRGRRERRPRPWQTVAGILLAGVLACASVSLPASADTPAPRFVLVLASGITLEDLGPRCPHLRDLARGASVALMSVPVAGRPTPEAAYLTIALGTREPVAATDADAYAADEAVERTTAAVVLARRTGAVVSASAAGAADPPVVHLGIAPLLRRGLADQTVGGALARGDRLGDVAFGSNAPPGAPERVGALLAVGPDGIGGPCRVGPRAGGPAGLARWAAASPAAGVVVSLAGGAPAVEEFIAALPPGARRVLVVSPYVPRDSSGRRQLALALLAGPGVRQGLLTSATTRTPGLIANVDIAPTVLAWLGVRAPTTMIGRPAEFAPSWREWPDEIPPLERAVRVNETVLDPLLIGLGVAVFLATAAGLLAVALRPPAAAAPAFALLALLNMPLAMLLAVLMCLGVPSLLDGVPVAWQPWAYAAVMVACMLAGAAAAHGLRRRLPAPALVGLATCVAVVADAFLGGRLVKYALLSSYQLSGIRFYGIGNEYMGIVVGFGLLAAFLLKARPLWAGIGFAAMAVVMGHPSLGAKAGGVIVTVAAFGLGWWTLMSRRPGWRAALGWTVAGAGAAVVVALLDETLARGASSHMGAAVSAAGQRGGSYLLQIALRKELMNLRILLHPGMMATLASVGALLLLAGAAMHRTFRCLAARHPEWVRGLPVAAWGALVAFVVNDSGIVAAAFLFGSFLVAGLWFLFADAAATAAQPGTSRAR